MAPHALVYYTHLVNDRLKRELSRLQEGLPATFDRWAVGCCEYGGGLDELRTNGTSVQAYVRDSLSALPYPGRISMVNWATLRGSPDLTLLRFFLDHPRYDYYWFIEYDVAFTGRWRVLFDDLLQSKADLLCAHVTEFAQDPDWVHWKSFSGNATPADRQLRGFLPFCRASRRLLEAIDKRCRQGWAGHPEVLWPTTARVEGFDIEEIGGTGLYTPEARRNRYYFSASLAANIFLSTFGAWPFYSHTSNFVHGLQPENVLWHPVKE